MAPVSLRIDPMLIRYEGIFEWDKLYLLIVAWLKRHRFEYYEKKNIQKTGTFGYEIEYDAKNEREESAYVKYDVKVYIHAFHIDDIEIIKDGKKLKKQKSGLMTIQIIPNVTLDWQGRWNSGMKKKTQDFMHKYMLRKTIERWEDKLHYEMYKLYTEIKEELDLESKYSAYQHYPI